MIRVMGAFICADSKIRLEHDRHSRKLKKRRPIRGLVAYRVKDLKRYINYT